MDGVRYKIREVLDKDKIEAFLRQVRIGHLGMADGHLPYVVPLNFVWTNGKLYFHGAAGGRRNQVMEANPEVCFTVSEEYGTITDPVPAKTDTAYMSVMIFGKAHPVDDLDEATRMLQEMIDKYVPGYYNRPLPQQHVDKYRSTVFGGPVRVYRIDPHQITAKENQLEEGKMFKPGKTV
ncbi:pyridoxamine 5-phosphate oxidase [Paenibacillus sp. MY03]|jgi:nitroimidazol reductase NimA-like FMN-containing flavoprotein (pyridoxamine 5'-phosphate oxidase superfamily)|uniref:pyridoxamine 5'-phosphate oxidase family protein n=1 Tax=unclassified Paenibacillus TaxID=185978 RepID=UPI000B3BFB74|nr:MULTISPECIES: pyridoxamine 5'-phosphate oxidase family protein [unclassified Paenibacillus]OUS78535.1 pyridoxamine 5-phosphate oxidase [Paenibacillus sp. MY03]QNK56521.1 pyridoxamine 5'-phosphate oxidase family protein [Paenibacillus sp. PAMC21692]